MSSLASHHQNSVKNGHMCKPQWCTSSVAFCEFVSNASCVLLTSFLPKFSFLQQVFLKQWVSCANQHNNNSNLSVWLHQDEPKCKHHLFRLSFDEMVSSLLNHLHFPICLQKCAEQAVLRKLKELAQISLQEHSSSQVGTQMTLPDIHNPTHSFTQSTANLPPGDF